MKEVVALCFVFVINGVIIICPKSTGGKEKANISVDRQYVCHTFLHWLPYFPWAHTLVQLCWPLDRRANWFLTVYWRAQLATKRGLYKRITFYYMLICPCLCALLVCVSMFAGPLLSNGQTGTFLMTRALLHIFCAFVYTACTGKTIRAEKWSVPVYQMMFLFGPVNQKNGYFLLVTFFMQFFLSPYHFTVFAFFI